MEPVIHKLSMIAPSIGVALVVLFFGSLASAGSFEPYSDKRPCADDRREIKLDDVKVAYSGDYFNLDLSLVKIEIGEKRLQYFFESTQQMNETLITLILAHNSCSAPKDNFYKKWDRYEAIRQQVSLLRTTLDSVKAGGSSVNLKNTFDKIYADLMLLLFPEDPEPRTSKSELVFKNSFHDEFKLTNFGEGDLICQTTFPSVFRSTIDINRIQKGASTTVLVMFAPDVIQATVSDSARGVLECNSRKTPTLELKFVIDKTGLEKVIQFVKAQNVGMSEITVPGIKDVFKRASPASKETGDLAAIITFAEIQEHLKEDKKALMAYNLIDQLPKEQTHRGKISNIPEPVLAKWADLAFKQGDSSQFKWALRNNMPVLSIYELKGMQREGINRAQMLRGDPS